MDALLEPKLTYERVQSKIDEAKKIANLHDKDFDDEMAKATEYFKAKQYKKVIIPLINLIANSPKGDSSDDKFTRAVNVYNLASALHRIGNHDTAKLMYQDAIAALDHVPMNCFTKCCTPIDKQVAYMKSNAALNERRQLPPDSQYLDANGDTATWTDEEVGQAFVAVAMWEAEKAESEAKANPVKAVQKGTTELITNVSSAVAGVGDVVGGAFMRLASVGKISNGDSSGQKDLV